MSKIIKNLFLSIGFIGVVLFVTALAFIAISGNENIERSFAFENTDANSKNIATTTEERPYAASLASTEKQKTDKAVRDEQGKVSLLSTDTHNPYNGQIRLNIDIGSEFAEFENSDFSEGKIIKITPGGTIKAPKLKPLPGYYFVGWCQGGVPETPTWDIFTTEITVDDNIEDGKDMSVYAIYADDNGDGFCTCGAWTKGIYTDKLDEIKANNAKYLETIGENIFYEPSYKQKSEILQITIIILSCILIIFIIWLYLVRQARHVNSSKKDNENTTETEKLHQ